MKGRSEGKVMPRMVYILRNEARASNRNLRTDFKIDIYYYKALSRVEIIEE